jgi:hypothetical protein
MHHTKNNKLTAHQVPPVDERFTLTSPFLILLQLEWPKPPDAISVTSYSEYFIYQNNDVLTLTYAQWIVFTIEISELYEQCPTPATTWSIISRTPIVRPFPFFFLPAGPLFFLSSCSPLSSYVRTAHARTQRRACYLRRTVRKLNSAFIV